MSEYTTPVDKLLTLGDCRGSRTQWPDYLGLGLDSEHIPELIRMATDSDLHWADSESSEVWAPIHAWRTLGKLRAEAAIEPLLDLFDELEDDDWTGEELPEVYGMIGSAAIPALKTYLADTSHKMFPRIHAASSLEHIGLSHRSAREDCIDVLAQQLEAFEENEYELNGFLVTYLVELEAVNKAPLMERAFAAGRVDETIMGDWEDVQVDLGLKLFREKDPEDDFFANFAPEEEDIFAVEGPSAAQRSKAKAKRKIARQSRQKNRKKKKKKKKR